MLYVLYALSIIGGVVVLRFLAQFLRHLWRLIRRADLNEAYVEALLDLDKVRRERDNYQKQSRELSQRMGDVEKEWKKLDTAMRSWIGSNRIHADLEIPWFEDMGCVIVGEEKQYPVVAIWDDAVARQIEGGYSYDSESDE